MVLFLTLAIAATVVSPPFENKSSAEEVFSKCEALLEEWEGEHPIYMSREARAGHHVSPSSLRVSPLCSSREAEGGNIILKS